MRTLKTSDDYCDEFGEVVIDNDEALDHDSQTGTAANTNNFITEPVTINHEGTEVENESAEVSSWTGFKLCDDNLDKTVKPRFMRIDRQACSLHFFNSFAVLDRIDLSSFSGICIQYTLSFIMTCFIGFMPAVDTEVDIEEILPSHDIHASLMHNMTILVSRILVKNLSFFKLHFEDVVENHIKHKYTKSKI